LEGFEGDLQKGGSKICICHMVMDGCAKHIWRGSDLGVAY